MVRFGGDDRGFLKNGVKASLTASISQLAILSLSSNLLSVTNLLPLMWATPIVDSSRLVSQAHNLLEESLI